MRHYTFTTSWDDGIVLESFDERSPVCKFGGLVYPRGGVLNGRLENSLRFHYRGQMVEGMILASGLERIPHTYLTGAISPFQITFTDSLEQEISVEANLCVDRTAKPKNHGLRPRNGGLYARSEIPAALANNDSVMKTVQSNSEFDFSLKTLYAMDINSKESPAQVGAEQNSAGN